MQTPQSDTRMQLIRAAQYIRMSTENQQYSTENQADAIREYAETRGYEIVRTYADHGKSGLRVEGREALRELLNVHPALQKTGDPSPRGRTPAPWESPRAPFAR